MRRAHAEETRVSTEDGPSVRRLVTCHLTRGSSLNLWHVWNVSRVDLNLGAGELFRARPVALDPTTRTSPVLCRALEPIRARALSAWPVLLGCDLEWVEPSSGVESAVAQTRLGDVCSSKGIDCIALLEHYEFQSTDRETDLGSRAYSLYQGLIRQALSRKYDIAHHYSLFCRILRMHRFERVNSSELPELDSVLEEGGLLDRCARDHASAHGVPLVGTDHLHFSAWEGVRNSGPRDAIVCRPADEDSAAKNVGAFDDHADEDYVAKTVGAFNNHAGALTDGKSAFPYAFTLRLNRGVTFDALVKYCVARDVCETLPGLPPREEWGSVNPVLLMEDPVDASTGGVSRRYTITSRGHLSAVLSAGGSDASFPCYNEVFLPGRPVSRLNLDLDVKCCSGCRDRLSARAEPSVRRKVSEAVAKTLILVIVESLLRLARVKDGELEPSFVQETSRSLGKIAVYSRVCADRPKLSLRTLWYLPVELCSLRGIEAYGPLLEEMERISKDYALLSYPEDPSLCGLCALSAELRTGGRAGERLFTGSLRLPSESRGHARRSCIDKGPYSFRKCVRLPNSCKYGSRFEYVGTFNAQDLEDPDFESPTCLSVGLSSNPLMTDVTSLGPRFRDLLEASGPPRAGPDVEEGESEPDRARAESEVRRLTRLWGVPVTLKKTGRGLYCAQARERSTTFPCPIHRRVHATCKLSALVFATRTIHKCFVP